MVMAEPRGEAKLALLDFGLVASIRQVRGWTHTLTTHPVLPTTHRPLRPRQHMRLSPRDPSQEDMDTFISAIIHLANRDYPSLVDDFIRLEILPPSCDRAKVPIWTPIYRPLSVLI